MPEEVGGAADVVEDEHHARQQDQDQHGGGEQAERHGNGHRDQESRLERLLEHERREPEHGGDGGQQDRPEARPAGAHEPFVDAEAFLALGVVEVDEDQRVVDDDAGQRDEPDQTQERQVEPEHHVPPNHADGRERDDRHHRERLHVAAEQRGEQEVDHHQRREETPRQRRERLGLPLLSAGELDGQPGVVAADALEIELRRDRLGADVRRGVGGDGDRALLVDPLDRRVARRLLNIGDLTQRHGLAGGPDEPRVLHALQTAACRLVGAHAHIDILLLGGERVRIEAEQVTAQLRGDGFLREPERGAGGLELHLQLELAEVVVVGDVVDALECRELLFEVGRGAAEGLFIGAAQLDGDVGPAGAAADFGEADAIDSGELAAQVGADVGDDFAGRAVALLDRVQLDEDLRDVGRGRFGAAAFDVGPLADDGGDAAHLGQVGGGALDLPGDLGRLVHGRADGHARIDDDRLGVLAGQEVERQVPAADDRAGDDQHGDGGDEREVTARQHEAQHHRVRRDQPVEHDVIAEPLDAADAADGARRVGRVALAQRVAHVAGQDQQ